jgi:YD repeat-containing protein
MISKTVGLLAIAIMFCSMALAQNGCTQYHTWDLSGAAGTEQEGPGGSSNWQANKLSMQNIYGGTGPSCSYTWIPQNLGYYGDCYSVGNICSSTPTPPPASAPETTPGPGCPSCGHPITLASGNTYISQNDLTIPGIGGGLKLTRSWNSLWPTSQLAFGTGLFGNNWRSTYEERVFLGTDGTIKYSRSDGSFWSFLLYGSPAIYHLVAPANGQATMTEQGTTSWTITFQNGERRLFDYNSGWLTQIIDRNGNQTVLAYDSLSRLTSVTDSVSRHLYFSYGSSSSYLVTGVSSDVGVSLSYAYDSQGRLLTVTKPDQTTVLFQYNSNSFITAVTDSQGKILESHTYDSTGRGLTSSRANGVDFVTVSYGNQ